MNTDNMIEIGEHHIIPLVKKVYEMSMPVGMGFLQPYEEDIPEDFLKMVENNILDKDISLIAYMDYVNGRQCKFNTHRDIETGKFYIRDSWYDHTEEQFAELLTIVNDGSLDGY